MDPLLEVELYIPADPFFGTPFLDLDEERASPIPYRHVHGGFAGTDTRFTFYFPTGRNIGAVCSTRWRARTLATRTLSLDPWARPLAAG